MPAANIVPTEVGELKDSLYQILQESTTPAEQDKDVSLTQTLGVSLTSAIKKDGVNIIQLQNHVDNRQLAVNVIEALRTVDSLHEALLTGQCKVRPAQITADQQEIKRLQQELNEVQTKLITYDGDVQDGEVIEDETNKSSTEEKLDDVLVDLFHQGMLWATFQDMTKKRYIEIAIKLCKGDLKKASLALGVNPQYFKKIMEKMDVVIPD